MARLLRDKFPRAQIITGDAWHLDHLLRSRREPVESVGAVISSLPLLNFPQVGSRGAHPKDPRRAGTGRQLGAIQLSPRQETGSRRGQLQAARLKDYLAEFPTRPRQRISEVTPGKIQLVFWYCFNCMINLRISSPLLPCNAGIFPAASATNRASAMRFSLSRRFTYRKTASGRIRAKRPCLTKGKNQPRHSYAPFHRYERHAARARHKARRWALRNLENILDEYSF